MKEKIQNREKLEKAGKEVTGWKERGRKVEKRRREREGTKQERHYLTAVAL